MPSPLHPRFLAEYIGPSPIIIEAGAADGTGNATARVIPRPVTAGVTPRPVTAGVILRPGTAGVILRPGTAGVILRPGTAVTEPSLTACNRPVRPITPASPPVVFRHAGDGARVAACDDIRRGAPPRRFRRERPALPHLLQDLAAGLARAWGHGRAFRCAGKGARARKQRVAASG
jgi:hypothetical protein